MICFVSKLCFSRIREFFVKCKYAQTSRRHRRLRQVSGEARQRLHEPGAGKAGAEQAAVLQRSAFCCCEGPAQQWNAASWRKSRWVAVPGENVIFSSMPLCAWLTYTRPRCSSCLNCDVQASGVVTMVDTSVVLLCYCPTLLCPLCL